MPQSSGEAATSPVLALVSYIPNPLGEFLNQLRRDLVPGCNLQSHVTILPPRPQLASIEVLVQNLSEGVRSLPPLRVEIDEVETFAKTEVVYLGVKTGWNDLAFLHKVLGVGPLAFDEPHQFHPHITLAQDLNGLDFPTAVDLATKRWADWPRNDRSFQIDELTFVQNVGGIWQTLERFRLKTANLLKTA